MVLHDGCEMVSRGCVEICHVMDHLIRKSPRFCPSTIEEQGTLFSAPVLSPFHTSLLPFEIPLLSALFILTPLPSPLGALSSAHLVLYYSLLSPLLSLCSIILCSLLCSPCALLFSALSSASLSVYCSLPFLLVLSLDGWAGDKHDEHDKHDA